MRGLTIAGRRIADDTPAFIIAELGHNHGGSVETCKAMIGAAKIAGVDAVKLQKRSNKDLFTRQMYDSPYNSEHAFGATYGEHREALEFDFEQYRELKAYAENLGLVFFATAFDIPSVDFLVALGVPAIKIASGCLTDIPLITYAAKKLPLIISTGGGSMEDVERADLALPDNAQAAFLQCTAAYPLQPEEANLRVIETYRDAFPDVVIGLSDHHDGISLGPVAYMLGARIFEKHFTLSRSSKGSDHAFSLEPEGMRRFVRDIQQIPAALGDGVKRPFASEASGMRKMAKGIYPTDNFEPGHIIQPGDLALQSPGEGLPPWKVEKFYGRALSEPLQQGRAVDSSGVLEP